MRRRLITNLVLLLAAAVGAALVYFEPWAEPPKKAPRLTEFETDKVDRVEIRKGGQSGEAVVLIRQNGDWQVSKPFAMRAETRKVESLLEGLRQRTQDHFAVGDRNLGEFGLKNPSIEVKVAGTTVGIGNKVPTERAMYARVGDTIYTVDTGLMRTVDQPATDYVASSLVPADAKITAIDGGTFKVVREADDGAKWAVTKKPGPVAKDAGKTLARAWKSAVASDIKPRNDNGEVKVDVRVHTQSRDTPYQFTRLKPAEDGKVPVTRPGLPVRYLVSQGMADRLFGLQKPEKNKDNSAKAESTSGSGASKDRS